MEMGRKETETELEGVPEDEQPSRRLLRGLIVAGLAAVLAVHQSVVAHADVGYGLAQAAEFFAFTRIFRLVALCAVIFARTGSGAHKPNVARIARLRKMTLVIVGALEKESMSGNERFRGGL